MTNQQLADALRLLELRGITKSRPYVGEFMPVRRLVADDEFVIGDNFTYPEFKKEQQ